MHDTSAIRLRKQIRGCEDRHCDGVWDTSDPDVVAVRGTLTEAPPDTPAHERVVLISRDILANL